MNVEKRQEEMDRHYTIGAVATMLKMTPKAIRHYERIGLIQEPARSPSGYRLYSSRELEQLAFVSKAKALGFTLKEIKQIIGLRMNGKDPCAHVRQLFQSRLAEISQQIESLIRFRAELTDYYNSLRVVPGQMEECDICESLGKPLPANKEVKP